MRRACSERDRVRNLTTLKDRMWSLVTIREVEKAIGVWQVWVCLLRMVLSRIVVEEGLMDG